MTYTFTLGRQEADEAGGSRPRTAGFNFTTTTILIILETRHGPDDASTSLQIVRSKLVVMLIVFFFANRVVVACQLEPAKTQVSRT